jgi:hypothetical protein
MTNLPAPVYKWLTLLLPPLSILICCLVMVPRQNKLQTIRRETVACRASIEDYLNKLQAISNLPPDPKIATLPMTKQEQSDFLRGLSRLCTQTGNRLIAISALAPPPPSPPPPPGSPPPQNTQGVAELPPGVTEIKSTIRFEGSFKSLRAFLIGVQRSARLVSLADCRVLLGQGGYPNLETQLTVARYVDTPETAPGNNADAAATQPGVPKS